jgi:shikimate kinase
MNVVLFGFMGVGKSVVGRMVAERLGMDFTDVDDEVVRRAGKPVSAIFEDEGEPAFRELESAVVREASDRDGQVIACGGGAVLRAENVKCLKRDSIMILLTADPETILERVERDGGTRPLLKADGRLERIESLLSERICHYLEVADIVIDTSGRIPAQVADDVVQCLEGMKDA